MTTTNHVEYVQLRKRAQTAESSSTHVVYRMVKDVITFNGRTIPVEAMRLELGPMDLRKVFDAFVE